MSSEGHVPVYVTEDERNSNVAMHKIKKSSMHKINKHGGYRQVVKTQGCGSCIRGFESHYPPHILSERNDVGVSPSGKATDSDSVMRRFESCYPSQFGDIAKW